ncbi:transcription-repair coupling factor [Rhabdochlamydiaceae symbiont of Dictyostelium giganteum]|uniref:transcription-repair coupling factor n=1 Tax=Rhabdochlamydiaceae symbiont of Dictyostelium giganteum TaxID=3342349 RepID=UPI0038500D00
MNFHSPSLLSFVQKSLETPSLLMEGLWDAPKTLLLSLLQKAHQKNILLIVDDPQACKIVDNAPFFEMNSVFEFPSWETLPGESLDPSQDIVGKRLKLLHYLLQREEPCIIIASLQAVLQKVPVPHQIREGSHLFKEGMELSFSALPEMLTKLGYQRAKVVTDKGEFAVRGGIIDIFPISSIEPFRLEFFGNTLESIRSFDPIGQKSIARHQQIFLSPANEKALVEEEQTSLFTYLNPGAVIFDNLLALENHWVSLQKLPSMTSKALLTLNELFSHVEKQKVLFWSEEPIEKLSAVTLEQPVGRAFYSGKDKLQPLSFECFNRSFQTSRYHHPFKPASLDHNPKNVVFIHEHESEKQVFIKEFPHILHPQFIKGYLSSGFAFHDSDEVIFPITELTHKQKVRREQWRSTTHTPPSDFHELSVGDLAVHFHHGIAKYLGIEKRPNHEGKETEYLLLEYAERSKLYVPIAQTHLVSRYIGSSEEIPTLHTLGTKNWQKAKASAQKAIVGYAQDLLRLHAEREVSGGFAFREDSQMMKDFEEEFPYPETSDQKEAILHIKKDMESPHPMDRLLCGDVGYGKTEVAMRSAFKAVADGNKQVAVLVPTTVLALQHYETFCHRMQNHPVVIKVISRFQTAKEVKKILQEVSEGKIDILLGTHRLLSKDVIFKNLGLIVIDEEHRFGVRAKEHLKQLKTGVDCISLSATPIPRTLYLSLLGAREISLINTPPQDRLPIKTALIERDPHVITNALLRELSRDGQAYFIHNRVESIGHVTSELQKLLPQAKILSGHGQMSGDELDTLFHSFKQGEADILVATTIVENGIDIPNANTILIDRADQFGLSSLYQLRGRVGRWNRPAFAYFLVPRLRELPEIARKRLNALLEAKGYGGGMKVAMRDLEIRGAGDILGTQQSGQVSTIGFHFYCKLLKQAVLALKKQQEPSFFETKMEFNYDAKIPETYIQESSLRLEMYHRFGESHTLEEVETLFMEMKDRFGAPPPPTLWLYHLCRIQVVASQKRYTLLKFGSHTLKTEQMTPQGTRKELFTLPSDKNPKLFEEAVLRLLS